MANGDLAEPVHQLEVLRQLGFPEVVAAPALAGAPRSSPDPVQRRRHVTAIVAFERATVGWFDRAAKQYRRIPVDERCGMLSLIGDVAEGQEGASLLARSGITTVAPGFVPLSTTSTSPNRRGAEGAGGISGGDSAAGARCRGTLEGAPGGPAGGGRRGRGWRRLNHGLSHVGA